MNKAIISFVASIIIGFGLGYLVFGVVMGDSDKQPQVAQTAPTNETTTTNDRKKEPETASIDEANILNSKGCLGCHAVDKLGLEGGETGPDLSKAFTDVEGKHGKTIEEFFKENQHLRLCPRLLAVTH